MSKKTIFWFRRDLRIEDNAGLYHALKEHNEVIPLFIFDSNILDELEDKEDARVTFIYDALESLKKELNSIGSDLLIKIGAPIDVWKNLVEDFDINAVYTNRDYEPYAKSRDNEVKEVLLNQGISFHDFKDHLIFEEGEVLKDDGDPYIVFTPYKRKWLAKIDDGSEDFFLKSYPTEKYATSFSKNVSFDFPALEEIGFKRSKAEIPGKDVKQKIIRNYDETRNFPGIEGTSRLGVHFRFGTISIREKARKAWNLNKTYLNELIWRDFYAQILSAFPKVVDTSFREEYDRIEWRNNEQEFERWCKGETGYKIVDAGMRELNETGYMHNRVRMITASFLTKHLLIDWRWGESYFAKKLLDYDLASNNGGWQWAAGCGTDAAPYFRIFNPYTQVEKFDKELKYIKKWVPEHNSKSYPEEIVEHKFARERCLETYKKGLNQN